MVREGKRVSFGMMSIFHIGEIRYHQAYVFLLIPFSSLGDSLRDLDGM
jgi:hypothetical protein